MEQGLLESLIASLPNDLAEFVLNDNKAFHLERRKWDEEQERKKQEAKQRKQNDEANSELEVTSFNILRSNRFFRNNRHSM